MSERQKERKQLNPGSSASLQKHDAAELVLAESLVHVRVSGCRTAVKLDTAHKALLSVTAQHAIPARFHGTV